MVEISLDVIDGDTVIVISDSPPEDESEVFLMSWAIMMLVKGFVTQFPEHESDIKRLVEIMSVSKEAEWN